MEKLQNSSSNNTNYGFLNGNVLKIIALVAMTIDHVGVIMFPELEVLRMIGRIAFPLFAFFVAEGCKYTRNKWRYWGMIFGLGVVFEIFSRIFAHTTECNIFITFSLSILLIYLLSWAKKTIKEHNAKMIVLSMFAFVFAAAAVYVLVEILPSYTQRYTAVDYGFFGVMVAVFVSVFDKHYARVTMFAIALVLLCALRSPVWLTQWFCLLAVPLVAWYNGERGKLRLKYLFYVYYPAHLLIIYGIAELIKVVK
ncbi:MAG: hypothetical protein IJ542_01820 [Clostridia bacterium]|nr:hypothetical protein [Clostridia bacterium]